MIEALGKGALTEIAEGCSKLVSRDVFWEDLRWLGVNLKYLQKIGPALAGGNAAQKYEAALVVTACMNRALGDVRIRFHFFFLGTICDRQ